MPDQAMPDLSADLRRLLELMNEIRDRLGEFSQVDPGEDAAASKSRRSTALSSSLVRLPLSWIRCAMPRIPTANVASGVAVRTVRTELGVPPMFGQRTECILP
jgi:hypothetical protein